ncbi:MAG: DUF1501 domain-containing protein [Planctomycetaceae bacterium]|nr:DUF1501 domain-containing protein [Planctomycetaceae bacterium]
MHRRRCLQIGGLSLLGLNVLQLQELRAASTSPRRQNSCVFVFLFGGPSHIDLWDMKPGAPLEIRGEFQPIATTAPGVEICEHLPRLAQQADKLCLLRSMTHRMNVHGPACSEIYSGREYFGPPVTDQARPEDWPSLSALVARYGQSTNGLPPAIVLPWYTQFVGQDQRIAGQTGGRMGEQWNPFLINSDPSAPGFEVQGVNPQEALPGARLAGRRRLLRQLDANPRASLREQQQRVVRANQDAAWALIEAAQSQNAFALSDEPPQIRQQYGPTKFGQSLLLARRMVEAGVSLVTVNWDDDSRFDKVSPHWDTHHQNFAKLKTGLCPVFDQGFSAFLADMHLRGLLDSTLVVVLGEFGRSPRIGTITQNNMTEKTGRDHWPHAFTALVAGGGVRGGQVYGSTIDTGGFVADNPVGPADLSATILHHLGIDAHQTYDDQFQQVPRHLSEGRVVTLG